ncbi:MAG TPA: ATP-dependent DNA helicase UvrD2 [Acidimicrobiales bacterium]|nr:ATP-dependent DNA helicase UvrD2 [Acidimicrobiales bacterium]
MGIDHTFPPRGEVPSGEALLDGLDPDQLVAVTSEAAPLCILAGAGSGKTRVLTRRIAHRVATGTAHPGHVLALTFTRRAAGELGRRLAALGVRPRVAAGTFHGIAYAALRSRWADRGQQPPVLLEHKVRLLAGLLPGPKAGSVPERSGGSVPERSGGSVPERSGGSVPERSGGSVVAPADLAAEIEWARARMVLPEDYPAAVTAAGRRPPLPAGVVAELFGRYEHEKRRRNLVDFDDLVLLCAEALETDAEFAATQRWRFRHLFVDEFQDVNPAQFRLLQAWRGGRSDLCVVGDPDQAIYAWNGADPSYLTAFARHLPGAAVVRLSRTYRSSPQVVAVANAVLAGHRAAGAAELRPTCADGAVPTVTAWASGGEEAAGIARALRRQHAGGRAWSELAVLARTRAQLVAFEEALQAAAIPCRVRGAVPFLDRPEVRAAVADLRRRPATGALAPALVDLRLASDLDDPQPGPLAPPGAAAERRASLDELARMMEELVAADPAATVGAFLAWLHATLRAEEPAATADAVELATFHGAKGLEWPVVFVTGLEQGLVPVGHATTPESRAEERRLLYVALTRARSELHCSWAERRRFGTSSVARTPSPWLGVLEAAVESLAAPGPDADWRRHLAASRARVEAVAGLRGPNAVAGLRGPNAVTGLGERADPALLGALRAWRACAARAAGVPAFVVLHDTTLAAVAEACPADRAALLALPGLGPVKAERYGDALLAVVAGGAGS